MRKNSTPKHHSTSIINITFEYNKIYCIWYNKIFCVDVFYFNNLTIFYSDRQSCDIIYCMLRFLYLTEKVLNKLHVWVNWTFEDTRYQISVCSVRCMLIRMSERFVVCPHKMCTQEHFYLSSFVYGWVSVFLFAHI